MRLVMDAVRDPSVNMGGAQAGSPWLKGGPGVADGGEECGRVGDQDE